MKPVELVSNALELPGDLDLCSVLPLAFRGLLSEREACSDTDRKREPVASTACKEKGPSSERLALPRPPSLPGG